MASQAAGRTEELVAVPGKKVHVNWSGHRRLTPTRPSVTPLGGGAVVVVGGGIASVRLVQELRRHGYDGRVTLVCGEAAEPYDRPQLSKELLRGLPLAGALLDGPASRQLDVEVVAGRRAVSLLTDRREVVLDDGTVLAYEQAVVATGARPRVPAAFAGGEHMHLRTLDDALRLRERIRQRGQLTIVGGGFIGCEVASSARSAGASVVLVESLAAPLARVVGDEMSQKVADAHARAGVDLRLGTTVLGATSDARERGLRLSDGGQTPADAVLLAVGVEPDVDWLAGSGLRLADGILCDAFGRTSAPGVWALGDAASWWSRSADRHRRLEHWTSAVEQAAVVAVALSGNDDEHGHDPVPYVWSDQYGVRYQIVGTMGLKDNVTVVADGGCSSFMALYSHENRVTGAFAASMPKPMARLRGLLNSETSVAGARRCVDG